MPKTDVLAVFRSKRECYRSELREVDAVGSPQLVELRETMRQIECWSALAEYREQMLLDQVLGIDRCRRPR